MKGEEPGWSLDLLRHPSVVQSLGERLTADIVYLALRHGRMRIPAECTDEILALIGERALECSCLPNFRNFTRPAALSAAAQPNATARHQRNDRE